jgi:hypothetical protein
MLAAAAAVDITPLQDLEALVVQEGVAQVLVYIQTLAATVRPIQAAEAVVVRNRSLGHTQVQMAVQAAPVSSS